ncbi:FAD dependent oxidoreductase TIGR03364 [Catalinimonas alkaloidigena]|uniref:FAD dependent oxidoreductase TIGR03364 n=1 Tax=Catalinimonas alkaloidigena TaxID=1075417 RepID=A0A1G9NI81_9BACT|nr:TIGR03364 family FAD-dependent oxidoreductase [Catalinimonas alkaloidigena]SDL85697.1 FAD dependent oxidoreductase TIGR03364 [Catalinimonas alkaloidigena]
MRKHCHADVAVVGAGIVGLATALANARRGQRVVLLERSPRATGASIRNFGLIWPIGQTAGPALQRALRSRDIWQEVTQQAGIWTRPNGSLHLAYHPDEWQVLQEFAAQAMGQGYACRLLSPDAVRQKSPAVKPEGLQGGLWSETEMTVDPREAIRRLPDYLHETYGVRLCFNETVTEIEAPYVHTATTTWEVDRIFVCSGSDFETLYPQHYAASGITKCKLQMMRTAPQPGGWQLGPSLCAGLTLGHYTSFSQCPSLPLLQQRFAEELPEYVSRGIHLLLAQNGRGELVIGDSHEYGDNPEPFDREDTNQLILRYLRTFADVPSFEIAERWHGIYPKLAGHTEWVTEPAPGVTLINALSGAGMTLSFGLAEEVVQGTYQEAPVTKV